MIKNFQFNTVILIVIIVSVCIIDSAHASSSLDIQQEITISGGGTMEVNNNLPYVSDMVNSDGDQTYTMKYKEVPAKNREFMADESLTFESTYKNGEATACRKLSKGSKENLSGRYPSDLGSPLINRYRLSTGNIYSGISNRLSIENFESIDLKNTFSSEVETTPNVATDARGISFQGFGFRDVNSIETNYDISGKGNLSSSLIMPDENLRPNSVGKVLLNGTFDVDSTFKLATENLMSTSEKDPLFVLVGRG